MKEIYTRPIVANSDIASNSNGIWPIVAAAAGYAAARKITHAIKAAPLTKLQGISRRNSH